jgi:hypothetical protein
MHTEEIVAMLVAERDRLSRAIEALQGPTKRRGRPPKNAVESFTAPSGADSESAPASAGPKKRSSRTLAQRKAQAVRMKAYWKKKRAAEAKG